MISVVVPTYNDAHFLPTALASCLTQTVPVEIVLVDDGSTTPLSDEVRHFIAEHRDIVTHVRHAWNCGLSAARNTGIVHARFDLIIPLDADDWFLPGTLAPLASALTDEVDIVYGNVFDSGTLYEPVKRPLRREDFLEDTPLFCGSLFRRRVWQMAGGYTVRIGPHYEDWNFWAKAFKAGCRFHYVPLTVYEHRSRPDSMLRHLHNDRARYVRVATEPLLEPVAAAPEPVAPAPIEAVTPVVTPVATPDETLTADLRRAHARIGQLMIELEQAKARPADVPTPQRSSELVLAHARIGRLTLELEQARARNTTPAAPRRSAALVSAHAAVGRLMLQRTPPDSTSGGDGA